MAKRSIEDILDNIRKLKADGVSTSQAMAASMSDREFDDLIELVDRLQRFWRQHVDPAVTRD
jgi:phosphohistidine phosphatase SixA